MKSKKAEIELRDYFATQALASFHLMLGSEEYEAGLIAKQAYRVADAMIEEREKGKED